MNAQEAKMISDANSWKSSVCSEILQKVKEAAELGYYWIITDYTLDLAEIDKLESLGYTVVHSFRTQQVSWK